MVSLVDEFIEYLQDDNKSSNTCNSYRKACEEFMTFINQNNIPFSCVRRLHIDSYLGGLIKAGKSFSTRNQRLSVLKSFFKWANEYEKIDHIPTKSIHYTKVAQRSPHWFSTDNCQKLYQSIDEVEDTKTTNFTTIRNKAIFLCGVLAGCRRCEIAGLNIGDIIDNKLHIIGKGNKERFVDISDALKEAIGSYLKIRPNVEENALFLSYGTYKRISMRDINSVMAHIEKRAGLPTGVHILRHTCASQIYKATHDIYRVQNILGHKKIDTTLIYTHVDDDDRKEAINANPLNNVLKS